MISGQHRIILKESDYLLTLYSHILATFRLLPIVSKGIIYPLNDK